MAGVVAGLIVIAFAVSRPHSVSLNSFMAGVVAGLIVIAFAVSRPHSVSLNEILIRPTAQSL